MSLCVTWKVIILLNKAEAEQAEIEAGERGGLAEGGDGGGGSMGVKNKLSCHLHHVDRHQREPRTAHPKSRD